MQRTFVKSLKEFLISEDLESQWKDRKEIVWEASGARACVGLGCAEKALLKMQGSWQPPNLVTPSSSEYQMH